MAKRRTKAQKLRAAVRRQEQAVTAVVKEQVVPVLEAMPKGRKLTAAVAEPAPAAPASYRQVDLKRSLWLLVILVSAQLVLWLLFRVTGWEAHIYNWLKT